MRNSPSPHLYLSSVEKPGDPRSSAAIIDNLTTLLWMGDMTDGDRTLLCHVRDLAKCMEEPQQNRCSASKAAIPARHQAKQLRVLCGQPGRGHEREDGEEAGRDAGALFYPVKGKFLR